MVLIRPSNILKDLQKEFPFYEKILPRNHLEVILQRSMNDLDYSRRSTLNVPMVDEVTKTLPFIYTCLIQGYSKSSMEQALKFYDTMIAKGSK